MRWVYQSHVRQVVCLDDQGSKLGHISERAILKDSEHWLKDYPEAVEAWFDYWVAYDNRQKLYASQ